MKTIVFTCLFTIVLVKANCQFGYGTINFDDTINLFRIRIDTTVPNNIWQIGAPNKHIFKSAYSLPNAIITDTLNSYPINNNSVFYLRTKGDFNKAHSAFLTFKYRMDCDSLVDFGRIELSRDNGSTWFSIVRQFNPYYIFDSSGQVIKSSSSGDTLVFTGTSNGWYTFQGGLNLPENQWYYFLLYRFTFHSSSSFASRDGWMIDNIVFEDFWESVPGKNSNLSTYPNPSKDILTVNSNVPITEYEIMNSMGQLLIQTKTNDLTEKISVANLNPGIYFCKLHLISGELSSLKFVKE
jgi:hypothetical protein